MLFCFVWRNRNQVQMPSRANSRKVLTACVSDCRSTSNLVLASVGSWPKLLFKPYIWVCIFTVTLYNTHYTMAMCTRCFKDSYSEIEWRQRRTHAYLGWCWDSIHSGTTDLEENISLLVSTNKGEKGKGEKQSKIMLSPVFWSSDHFVPHPTITSEAQLRFYREKIEALRGLWSCPPD